ncbi:uncharacterized protein N7482_005357 [Penicillium canariense]|uniref:DUF6987 domain-containing protein n=1 Tax=Penicillium canariense TaxID=189055 RepID=A0A9W9I3Q8_9EURO|nr:uncharacterized protein N7482_005357 [Penicillium canariense]KAJ5166576.1 hypothetical protein N7482_005357 [Penicillium canariense]
MASSVSRSMPGKNAAEGPLKQAQASPKPLAARKKPDLESPKSSSSTGNKSAASKPKIGTKPSDLSSNKRMSAHASKDASKLIADGPRPSVPTGKKPVSQETKIGTKPSDLSSNKRMSSHASKDASKLIADGPRPSVPTGKKPVSQETKTVEGTSDDADDPKDEEDSGMVDLVDNEEGPIEAEDEGAGPEEQRGGAAKNDAQASGSGGRSVFQRGKDAATGLASFATRANKLHSQMPDPVKQQVTSRVQTGARNIMGTVGLDSAEAERKAQELKKKDFELPTDLSALSQLEVGGDGKVVDDDGNEIARLVEGEPEDLAGRVIGANGEILDEDGDMIGRVELLSQDVAKKAQDDLGLKRLAQLPVTEEGLLKDESGQVVGKVVEGDPEDLAGFTPNEAGEILDEDGDLVGRVELVSLDNTEEQLDKAKSGLEVPSPELSILKGMSINEEGEIRDNEGGLLGRIKEGQAADLLAGKVPNEQGQILAEDGEIIGQVELVGGEAAEKAMQKQQEAQDMLPSLSTLQGLQCNESGEIVDENGRAVGELVEGDPSKLSKANAQLDDQGQFWDSKGNIIGKAQTLPAEDQDKGPFADVEEPFVTDEGEVHDANGNKVGTLIEGEIRKVRGRAVDEDGDILDKRGNLLGRAEPWKEPEPGPDSADLSVLEGLLPNKLGIVMGPDGVPIARLSEGDPKTVTGRKIDAEGQIWGDDGEVIGRVTLIPEDERESIPPFGNLGDLVVRKTGFVEDETGDVVGKIVQGDPQKLQGLAVDEDGDIIDKRGNVKGHAEPYTPPQEEEQEEEEEEEEDISILEGKTVNKLGNVVDDNGSVWGRITSGNPKKLAGRQVDAEGQIWNDSGQVIGTAELVPAREREQAEGIFYGLDGLLVAKDGTITDSHDQVVGKLVEGDLARLKGRAVDEDGEVIDKVGNVIGRAERWTPEEKPREINPMSGRKVNREGEVRDEDGNLIGRLTEGNLKALVGKSIDDNGNIVDNDGNKIGECTLLEQMPDEAEQEPALSAEELEQQEKENRDRDLAKKMSAIVQQTLESVGPLCKQITEHIERADRTPREELDEEQLVKTVKPLIEDAGNMLQECKGALRALDPDGQIAASAKLRSVSHEATPEEYQLADLLKELSQTISTTIENGRKRIADMPHAKKKINPLWALLSEPLFQIIAAVGLLLSGVVGLLGNLLDGLGLGGLVRGLLGGLGIDNLLSGLGLGNVSEKLGMSG